MVEIDHAIRAFFGLCGTSDGVDECGMVDRGGDGGGMAGYWSFTRDGEASEDDVEPLHGYE